MAKATTKHRTLVVATQRERHYTGQAPYMREAVSLFCARHGVAYPWQATCTSTEIMLEWCELVADMRALYDLHTG